MTPASVAAPSFGIATAPQQVEYSDLLRVWREADTVEQIEQAWLFDHLLPTAGSQRTHPGGAAPEVGDPSARPASHER